MNLDLRYYFSVFLRRFPVFLVVALLVSAAAVTTAYLMPTTYEAQARLLVESPQIPRDLAASTVENNALEQLQILEQRLMTRSNLLEIAHRRKVFPDTSSLTPDQIVKGMRERTTIYRTGGKAGQATLMSISFRSERAQTAAEVVNDYVTILLRDSVQLRMGRAGDTLDFFEQEVERLDKELAAQSEKILAFKNANIDALPSDLGFRLNRQSLLQERITQLQRNKTLLSNQRARLIDIFNTTGRIGPPRDRPLSREERELAEAERKLEEALTVYSPENPRIKMLQAQVERLRAQVGGGQGEEGPDSTMLDLQLAEIDSQLAFIEEEIESATAELAEVQDAISRTPSNSVALEALQRDYENIQRQYNAAVERLARAATGERIEVLAKGQRISVIEQATVPTEPVAPNRTQIAVGGVLAGILAGIGAVVLLEVMNRSVRREADIVKSLGIAPLVVIPYTRTARQAAMRRAVIALATILITVGIPILLYYIHTRYLPLDLIVSRLVNRFRA